MEEKMKMKMKMKKLIALLLAAVLLICFCGCSSDETETESESNPPMLGDAEAPTPSEGLAYSVVENEIWITGIGSCTDTDLVIPDRIDGKPVTKIEVDAFHGNENITSVYIPDTVQDIGQGAFYLCKNLTSVTFARPTAWTTILPGTPGSTIPANQMANPSRAAELFTTGASAIGNWVRD